MDRGPESEGATGVNWNPLNSVNVRDFWNQLLCCSALWNALNVLIGT